MALIDFGGVKEEVVTRKEFSMAKARRVLKKETIAVIGYGVQGPAQALNMKDNGFNVIIGQSKKFKKDWNRAVKDGWKPGKTLFDIEEAATRGTVIEMLVSDAGQKAIWPMIKKCLNPGDCLYFSHGFSIVYKDQTKVIAPKDVDVVLCAPKGSGTSVRRNFLSGSGINASFAVDQDFSGRAHDRCIALGIAIGAGYLFPTTFKQEVYSDLTGERGVLMGGIAGLMEAQYEVLRKHGHSPSEAFNETVEEFTHWLMKTAWTGCIPTVRRLPSAVLWTGRASLRRPTSRLWKQSISGSSQVRKPAGCCLQPGGLITGNGSARNLRSLPIRKCGVPEKPPAACVLVRLQKQSRRALRG